MMERSGLAALELGISGGTSRARPEKVELCGEVVDWGVPRIETGGRDGVRIEAGSDEGPVMEV